MRGSDFSWGFPYLGVTASQEPLVLQQLHEVVTDCRLNTNTSSNTRNTLEASDCLLGLQWMLIGHLAKINQVYLLMNKRLILLIAFFNCYWSLTSQITSVLYLKLSWVQLLGQGEERLRMFLGITMGKNVKFHRLVIRWLSKHILRESSQLTE